MTLYGTGRPNEPVIGIDDGALRAAFRRCFSNRSYQLGEDLAAVTLKPYCDPVADLDDCLEKADLEFTIDSVSPDARLRVAIGEMFLWEAIGAVNVAVPGGLAVSSAHIYEYLDDYEDHIQVSSEAFEQSVGKLEWMPRPQDVTLADVVAWFDMCGIGKQPVATSSSQKAVASLLQIAHLTRHEPARVLWIVRALESLYEVSAVRSFQTLAVRSQLLLDVPESYGQSFVRDLRSLFSLRHKYAHGGGDFHLPAQTHRVRSEVGPAFQAIPTAVSFGVAVVIATLQRFIKLGVASLPSQMLSGTIVSSAG